MFLITTINNQEFLATEYKIKNEVICFKKPEYNQLELSNDWHHSLQMHEVIEIQSILNL